MNVSTYSWPILSPAISSVLHFILYHALNRDLFRKNKYRNVCCNTTEILLTLHYGIEGVLTWTVNGKPIEVGPGQALCIPRGAVHRFDNFGSENVKQLVIISPAIMGPAYFREAAEVIGAAKGGPPDPVKMMNVFRRHGMTIATPSHAN